MNAVSLYKVFLRSFFIQSSWSFTKMQSLGFASAIAPALKEIYALDPKAQNEALKRHMGFYNAHPYMASPVLGAAIRLEQKARTAQAGKEASAEFKKRVMAPYGALGDGFFWGSIRPLASCVGVLAAALWGLWGPVLFLVVYNVFHIWMRWNGLKKGYRLGTGVVEYIKALELPTRGVQAKRAASAALGILSTAFLLGAADSLSGSAGEWLAYAVSLSAAAIAATGLFYFLMRRGFSPVWLFYLAVIPLIALGVLGE